MKELVTKSEVTVAEEGERKHTELHLGHFTKLLLSGDYTKEQIYEEFLTYLGSEDVREGLMKRRIAEAKIFNEGIYDMNFKECQLE